MKLKTKKQGFTLVELIVVIAILGILAVITIPRFTHYAENARLTALDANAKIIYEAMAAAETNLIASGTTRPTNAQIVSEASKSLQDIELSITEDSSENNSYRLLTYNPADSENPSSFLISNVCKDGVRYTWENGGERKKGIIVS